jgi:hypothetical protein
MTSAKCLAAEFRSVAQPAKICADSMFRGRLKNEFPIRSKGLAVHENFVKA